MARLAEGGCFQSYAAPVGCTFRDSSFQEVVTAARGPDGACWWFLDSRIPEGFARSDDDCGLDGAPFCEE
jgi:hypothetical protein